MIQMRQSTTPRTQPVPQTYYPPQLEVVEAYHELISPEALHDHQKKEDRLQQIESLHWKNNEKHYMRKK
jgi:hypothetical protein